MLFIALALVSQYALLLLVLLYGGACGSCYDLAINTVGGDYERRYATRSMTIFHGGFSGGAALGAFSSAVALANGVGFRSIYMTVALLFLLLAVATLFSPLPTIGVIKTSEDEQVVPVEKRSTSIFGLLAIPLVLLATLLVSFAFFTDGALEGYISIYLRDLLGSGALLGGVGIAAFYLIGAIGKVGSTIFLRRYGERPVVTVCALLSTAGMLIALSTTSAPLAVLGLLLLGLGQAPLAPTAFSLASRVEAHQGARAIAVVTAFGYSIFLIGPPIIGALAALTSLRTALLLTIAASLSIVLIAQRLLGRHRL
jgi:MFS family permease